MLPRVLRTAISVAALGTLVWAGCGGSSGGGAAGKDSFIAQYCAEFAPCCAKVGRPTDGAVCRAFIGAFAPPNYDPAAADQCLAEVHAAASAPTFCDAPNSASAPSCNKVFGMNTGSAKPGDACTQDNDCAPSAEGKVRCASLFKNGTEIRKCQVQIAGKAGDSPCAGTVDGNITYFSGSLNQTDILPRAYLCDVATGVYCDGTSGACVAIGKVGDPCNSSTGQYVCEKTAYCDSATKTCTMKKSVGDSCTSFPDPCSAGNYCDSATMKCVVALPEGALCTMSQACASGSCVNGKCGKSTTTDLGLALLCGSG
jgi:hypothetical protein